MAKAIGRPIGLPSDHDNGPEGKKHEPGVFSVSWIYVGRICFKHASYKRQEFNDLQQGNNDLMGTP